MSDSARRWLPRLLIIVLAFVFARGICPFVPVEGDEQGVINGVIAAEQHRVNFLDFSYIYPIQPGSFLLLRAGHAISGISHIALFGSMSAVGAIAFIVVMSFLGARLCQCRAAWVALGLLSCQEMVSAGWYANTCAIAAPFTALALLLTLRSGRGTTLFFSALLIAIGGWIRLDSLLITPAFLPLAFARSRDWRTAITQTAAVALGSGALVALLLLISRTSFGEAWSTFITQPYGEGWISLWHKVWFVGSISFVALTVLAAAGLLWTRDLLLCVTAFAALLPPMFVYGHTFTTTKYLYYPLPFLVFMVIGAALKGARSNKRWARAVVVMGIVATIGEGIIGVRTSTEKSRRFSVQPAVTIASGQLPGRKNPTSLVFGEGEIIGTDDAFRVRTGWVFAASVWHREKVAAVAESKRIEALVRRDDATLLTSTYLSTRVVTGKLLREGAQRESRKFISDDETSFRAVWVHGADRITQLLINNSPAEVRLFSEYAADTEHAHVLFINDRGENAANFLGVTPKDWRRLSPSGNELLAVYEKK
jgi:hypothetical protein